VLQYRDSFWETKVTLIIPDDLSQLLEQAVQAAQAAGELPDDLPLEALKVERAKPEFGDYASPAAMQLAKPARMAPLKIAEAIAAHLPADDLVQRVTITPPGFVNFKLSPAWLAAQVDRILSEGVAFADLDLARGKRAQVECVSANPTGPITVGRTRGGVIGSTLANLLGAVGYGVEMEYYFNNAGRQMQILGESLRARYLEQLGQPFDFPEEGYKGEYLRDVAARLVEEQGDALVKTEDVTVFKDYAEAMIFEWIRNSLRSINIVFDSYFNEDSLYQSGMVWDVLERLEEEGYVYEANDAKWLKTTELLGHEKDRVMVKSTGEPTYSLPDIAYHIDKLERGFDLAVNLLGADHKEQYPIVAAGVRVLGYDADKIRVIIHQFVTLKEGGETRRMSTRKGEFVTLDELVNDVGPDAVRYFILARSPDAQMDFDLDLARQQSNENPVYYIQNAHVRCAGIERQAAERGVSMEGGDISLLTGERELALIRKMLELPEVIQMCVERLEPHHVAFYALDFARLFHPIYDELRALPSEVTPVPPDVSEARLKLYAAVKIAFARCLELMGMSAPETM
jgi:arginyl-tRNA synthetase